MSGKLPLWLAEWLGIEMSSAGDAANWRLDSAWRWPPWATVLLVLGIALWIAWLYAREATGAGRQYRVLLAALRLAASTLVLIMLAQWALALRLTGPPPFALVIDRSASMAIADRYEDKQLASHLAERLSANGLTEPTRLNLAKLLVTENNSQLLTEVERRYHLATYVVDDQIERLQPSSETGTSAAIRRLTSDGPHSGATRLGEAVRRVLEDFRGTPPAGVLLLTDGVNTEGVPLAEAARAARQAGVPILAVGVGSDESPIDIELADVLVDDAVFVDDLVSFQVQVKANGLEGQSAEVVLRRMSGEPPDAGGAAADSANAVAKQTITLPPAGQTLTLQLVDRPTRAGDATYIVEVNPHNDETNKDNNRQRRVVAVRDEKIRVLVVFGYPNYEFRFLKTLLERDATVQLSTYLQDADPENAEQDKSALRSLPSGREQLFEYDVVIVGDVDPRLVPRSFWPQLRAFVAEKGGGAAMIAGPRFLPWSYRDNADVATLLPVDVDSLPLSADNKLPASVTRGFRVLPTAIGLRTAAMQLGDRLAETEEIWRRLAPMYWLVEVGGLKPAAQVLATGPKLPRADRALRTDSLSPPSGLADAPVVDGDAPVICFQYFGAGRVLFHAIDSTWRWRIGVGDAFFARYWVQMIRYLARSKLSGGQGIELTTDRREYRRGEAVQLRARFRDARLAPASGEGVRVLIEAAGQARRQAVLHRNPTAAGLFEATVADLGNGQYDVLMSEPQVPGPTPTTRFTVVVPPGEMARTETDRDALTSAAETTHGRFYTMVDAGRLLAELPSGRRVPVENLPPIAIWNRWWLLSLVVACLAAEWILRKRKGML